MATCFKMQPLARALACLSSLASCGDPLVVADYPGEPLLDIEGPMRIEAIGELQGAEGPLRLAVFWARAADAPEGFGRTEFDDQRVSFSDLPGDFAARIYLPPLPESMLELDGQRVGLGNLIIYVDIEGDGRFDPGVDAPVGSSRDHLLLYVDGETAMPGLGTLARGFHLLAIERDANSGRTLCGARVPELINYERTDGPVVMVVDLLHSTIVDIDCDLGGAEYELCPPPPHIVEVCAGAWESKSRCFPWAHCQ